ncbi:DUF2007 domain-containing protein, partial [bacterium]|nr:DUF2007 domain-containing protein [bacterium]
MDKWLEPLVHSSHVADTPRPLVLGGTALMPTFRSAWHWAFGKHEPKPPNPDRTVEAGWVPQWMAPMIVDELHAQGVPAVTTDDYNLNLYMNSREPMARVFVTEDRRAEAREVMT